jgi:hypothetical protein
MTLPECCNAKNKSGQAEHAGEIEREGVKAGNVDIGVDVRHHEHVSPIVSTVLVVAGAGMMIAGSRAKRA